MQISISSDALTTKPNIGLWVLSIKQTCLKLIKQSYLQVYKHKTSNLIFSFGISLPVFYEAINDQFPKYKCIAEQPLT